MSYARFGAMIATSTIVMFGLMYLNTYALDHIFYSQTRTWMAIYMGAVMAVIMLLSCGACTRTAKPILLFWPLPYWSSRDRFGWSEARKRLVIWTTCAP